MPNLSVEELKNLGVGELKCCLIVNCEFQKELK